MNRQRAGVGARNRFRKIGAAADNSEHASTGGDELTVSKRSPGVIDSDVRHALGSVDALNHDARFRRLWIPARSDDDADRAIVVDAAGWLREHAVCCGRK